MRHVLPSADIPTDIALLSDIDEGVRRRVLDCLQATYVAYGRGDIVDGTDAACGRTAYLVKGRAEGYTYDEDGNKSILHLFTPGQVVSYGQMLGAPSITPFDVVAREECRVVFLRTDRIPVRCACCREYVARVEHNLARAVANLGAELMATLDIRLRRTMRGKILAFLEYEARRQGSDSFDIALNRQELADYLCVDRAALSRELGNLRDEGQFEFERNHFVLHLKPKLKKGAQCRPRWDARALSVAV